MVRGHGTKFGRKKEEAIAALLSHRTIEDAARATKIGTNTLLRWLQVPEFRDAYLKARREAVHQAVARLQQAAGVAAAIILKLMMDPNVPAAVRLRAAEAVFGISGKGLENEDFAVRIAELERAAEESQPGWRKR
jgi:hypothetical protein